MEKQMIYIDGQELEEACRVPITVLQIGHSIMNFCNVFLMIVGSIAVWLSLNKGELMELIKTDSLSLLLNGLFLVWWLLWFIYHILKGFARHNVSIIDVVVAFISSSVLLFIDNNAFAILGLYVISLVLILVATIHKSILEKQFVLNEIRKFEEEQEQNVNKQDVNTNEKG